MVEEGNHYTVDEAARLLELSPACVRQMLRAGEIEGERREERIQGVLGPWRIPKTAVRALKEGDPGVLRTKHRAVCAADATTTTGTPLAEEATDVIIGPLAHESATVEQAPQAAPPPGEDANTDGPSETSQLLSESVREVREKAEALRKELELLEGRLELAEIAESTLRESLRREKERADREQKSAERLRVELEASRDDDRQDPRQETGHWLSRG